MLDLMESVHKRVLGFEKEAHEILSLHETSRSRVITLTATRRRLNGLSAQQRDMFDQSLLCLEGRIFRAAHIMAWLGLIDLLEEKLSRRNFQKVRSVRPNWAGFSSIEDVRDNVSEFQVIEVARQVGLLSKQEMKILHGLLARRSACAHPSTYNPGLNDSLGFVSEVIAWFEKLQQRRV